ncbi:MAG: cache domain-containing protein [Ideonella sp.]|nr:cache domain-containing protein [Ideonella sp.]
MVNGVRDVSGRLRDIAQASSRQSAGLEQVARSIDGLDEITRQNKEMVTESSAASQELVTRAGALSQAVAAIRLRQGSADEARDMVHKALNLIKTNGMDAAFATFRSADAGYVDRDLYVFVVDREGRYVVHAAKKAMEGHRVHEVPGIDGDRFTREAWEATKGQHWVEYNIVNQANGQVQPKASYVVALNDKWLIGCGIYRVGS